MWIANPQNSIYAEQSKKPLTIAFIKNNPPFSFVLPDGSPTGLYVEFWQLWSEINDIPVTILIDDFEEGMRAVKNRQVDIHSGLFKNQSRQQWAEFSLPFHSITTGILYNDNYSKSTKLIHMKGKKIAAKSGSYQAEYVERNYPEVELILYKDTKQIIYQLLDKEVAAIVSEIPYLIARTAQLGLGGVFTLSEEELITNNVHAVIAKGKPELLDILNTGINNIPIKKLNALEQKWLPSSKPFFRNKTTSSLLSMNEQQWLDQHPIISLGIDTAWPPFEFVDNNNNYSGITADYIQFVKDKLDIKMKPVMGLNWVEVMAAFNRGEIDVLPGVVKTSSRAKLMQFTEPVMSLPTVIVTRKNSYYVSSMTDIANKRVGIVRGYALAEFIKDDYSDITIVPTESIAEGIKKLQVGEIDAFIDAIAVINYELEKTKAQDVNIASFSPYNLELSMAVRKGMEPLVNILNKIFADMEQKEKTTIANNWLSVHVQTGTDIKTILLWTLPIAAFLIIVIIVIVRINRRMQSEIDERKRVELSLKSAREIAEAASKAKSDFLANMSHEIRTPMNAVIGMSHLLEESGLNEQQQEYLDTLNTSSSSLLILISDILDMSKIEAGKLELEQAPFLLKQVVKNISAQVELHIDPTKVTYQEQFDPSLPKALLGDSLRLGQVLLNIINNAMKFTEQGEIIVSITIEEQSDDSIKLLFSIADSGIGMTQEQQDHLFKTYSQADTSTTRKYGGTGLGLSICKSLCKLMDGEIWVESVMGQGSKFSFTAKFTRLCDDDPRAKLLLNKIAKKKTSTVNDSAQKQTSTNSWLTGKHLLVVDDNHVNLMIAKKILNKEGIQVTTAMNGEEALKVLETGTFDMVLMDIQMPVMDGYKATETIRNNIQYKDLPIIALSANVMKENIDKSFQVGMNDYLSKPINVEKLFAILEKYLH